MFMCCLFYIHAVTFQNVGKEPGECMYKGLIQSKISLSSA